MHMGCLPFVDELFAELCGHSDLSSVLFGVGNLAIRQELR